MVKNPVYVDHRFTADHCGGGRGALPGIIYPVRAGTAGAGLHDG